MKRQDAVVKTTLDIAGSRSRVERRMVIVIAHSSWCRPAGSVRAFGGYIVRSNQTGHITDTSIVMRRSCWPMTGRSTSKPMDIHV